MRISSNKLLGRSWGISLLTVAVFSTALLGCGTAAGNQNAEVQNDGSFESETDKDVDESDVCAAIDEALEVSEWGQYGLAIEQCGQVVSDEGEDVFLLQYNDPTEWIDLFNALGDIPEEEAAKYAFWRAPIGLLAMGFMLSKTPADSFDQIVIFFDNKIQTSYDILPRDVAYAIDIPDELTKEEYSEEFNKRIDEISLRVDVYNLNE